VLLGLCSLPPLTPRRPGPGPRPLRERLIALLRPLPVSALLAGATVFSSRPLSPSARLLGVALTATAFPLALRAPAATPWAQTAANAALIATTCLSALVASPTVFGPTAVLKLFVSAALLVAASVPIAARLRRPDHCRPRVVAVVSAPTGPLLLVSAFATAPLLGAAPPFSHSAANGAPTPTAVVVSASDPFLARLQADQTAAELSKLPVELLAVDTVPLTSGPFFVTLTRVRPVLTSTPSRVAAPADSRSSLPELEDLLQRLETIQHGVGNTLPM
jgi:hypothetical protein